MFDYKELGLTIINDGELKETRQGVKTLSLHGEFIELDLRRGFPLLTTKKINFKHIVVETLWYLLGTDKITFLKENGVHIWDKWADEDDYLGPTYGYQWRRYNGHKLFDQIADVINILKTNPNSRRAIINGWNPIQLDEMRLPPCITQLQFLSNDGMLDLIVTQRSADFAIGVPYDIAEMALLQHIIAYVTGLKVRKLMFMYGDIHIYEDHLEALKEQFERQVYNLPILKLDPKIKIESIDDFDIEDFSIIGYNPGDFIKYKVHV